MGKVSTRRGVIGILTGGGDVPGLNPAIRAVTIRALREGYQVVGLRRGWAGLIDIVRENGHDNNNNFQPLSEELVNRAGRTGGTFLHTSRMNPSQVKRSDIPYLLQKTYTEERNNQTFAPDECWSLRRGCMHALPAGDSSVRCTHLQAAGSSVCVPLIANGEAIGVLSIQNDDEFSDASTDSESFARRDRLASAVAEHIALAISNLSLREALRQQTIHDPLTGLHNRRYMQEFLEREILRARRKGRPLSLMMLDVDNFKRYNDTFGHPAGDEALRFVAHTLLRAVRADDLACRYGGEEFSLILPECSLDQASVRAEEIRAQLKALHMERASEIPGVLTVSIGVAAFEETTDQGNLLLKFADDALYQAKRGGRDRVVVARCATGAAELAATPTTQS
jgi:diguanylate cyclase (GGDEF)-like protein